MACRCWLILSLLQLLVRFFASLLMLSGLRNFEEKLSADRCAIRGIINTFGVFQTYYKANLLSASSASDISWIGSIQPFLLMIVSAIAGPIYDAGYSRQLVFAGSCLTVLGMFLLSICKEYWHVLLAQGICNGLGAGLLFVPSVAIISTYFTTKIATAVGIAACGSSVGT